jgi:hypothetical protein
MSVAPARRAALAVLHDRHGPAILSTVRVSVVTVPAFAETHRIAIPTPITITVTIVITVTVTDGDTIGTDPDIRLRQRD